PSCFALSLPHCDLPSFPTRRSSDLAGSEYLLRGQQLLVPRGHREAHRVRHLVFGGLVGRRDGQHTPADLIFENADDRGRLVPLVDRKSTRLNSSHLVISYAVFCLKK